MNIDPDLLENNLLPELLEDLTKELASYELYLMKNPQKDYIPIQVVGIKTFLYDPLLHECIKEIAKEHGANYWLANSILEDDLSTNPQIIYAPDLYESDSLERLNTVDDLMYDKLFTHPVLSKQTAVYSSQRYDEQNNSLNVMIKKYLR